MDWIKAALLALQLTSQFVAWVAREKAKTEAERAVLASLQETINAEIAKAKAARDAVAADPGDGPSRVHNPDEFQRD
ncbi:MAG TPA: hypothetical protein VG735_08095 [Caulobacterales bacterium]|nr:hypothetical protein [Caulobacterales bacterium]